VAQGIGVTVDGSDVALAVPLNVAFFNPNLLEQIGPGPMLQALGGRVAVQQRREHRQRHAQRAVPGSDLQ
jgi:hypothetical protein